MRQFGLIGRTLSHSFSQTYFEQKFHNQGLAADHRFGLFELAEIRELPALLQQHPNLAGLSVTVPYKEAVWPYLDEVAPSAQRVGAINCIAVGAGGRLVGHNTDVVGFGESLRRWAPELLRPPAGRALVLGTGGAAKAVEAALRELGIAYWLVSRHALAAGLTYDDLTPALVAAHPLIINATPLGTFPGIDECPPLPYHALTPQHYLHDLVYNPAETRFLRQGREAGAHTKNGFEMLCLQAEAAWDIWNGQANS